MRKGMQSWKNLVVFAFNFFSIPLLFKTLLSPWKMDKNEGSDFTVLEKTAFFIFSRILGFVARTILIVLGLMFTLLMICTFPIFFFIPINITQEHLQNVSSVGTTLSYGDTYTLSSHSRNITSPSKLKLYGRDKALRMIARGLSKGTNRNVLLVGDAGVGKSSLLGYLGRLGRSGISYPAIRNHRVVEFITEGLPLTDFNKCLNEAARAGNVILVLEKIHNLEQHFNKLLPYLNMPHLGIIATTDFSSYDQVMKAHPEFLMKFEKVDLGETDEEDTISVLKNNIDMFKISIEEDAIKEIVRLAGRLIANQKEPGKSLSILEELETLGRKITVGDVRQIISDRTNIPIGDIGADEKKVLIEIEGTMKKKIIGQDKAVEDVSQALKRLRTGVADPNKPAGSFLFLGPTGVGKTYTAKILAESYFGRKDAMIRFDMSEFSLASAVDIFTDRLASVIEEAPLSLVFFDELEKANPKIHNLLLQVLDEGCLTRGTGRIASFKNSIIIATSNAGSVNIIENPKIDKKTLINNLIKDNIFAPEFLNRFNSVVLFKPLGQVEAKKITTLLLNEFAERLMEDKNITLVVDDALINKVAEVGFDPDFGARPIKRAIEEIVENKVAEYIMAGNVGGTLKVL